MIDNEIRQKYRQGTNDLKEAFIRTWLYKVCEKAVERISRILR